MKTLKGHEGAIVDYRKLDRPAPPTGFQIFVAVEAAITERVKEVDEKHRNQGIAAKQAADKAYREANWNPNIAEDDKYVPPSSNTHVVAIQEITRKPTVGWQERGWNNKKLEEGPIVLKADPPPQPTALQKKGEPAPQPVATSGIYKRFTPADMPHQPTPYPSYLFPLGSPPPEPKG